MLGGRGNKAACGWRRKKASDISCSLSVEIRWSPSLLSVYFLSNLQPLSCCWKSAFGLQPMDTPSASPPALLPLGLNFCSCYFPLHCFQLMCIFYCPVSVQGECSSVAKFLLVMDRVVCLQLLWSGSSSLEELERKSPWSVKLRTP